jgi:hypothetical protein
VRRNVVYFYFAVSVTRNVSRSTLRSHGCEDHDHGRAKPRAEESCKQQLGVEQGEFDPVALLQVAGQFDRMPATVRYVCRFRNPPHPKWTPKQHHLFNTAQRAIAALPAGLVRSAISLFDLRAVNTNVLLSPTFAQGPTGTSLNSTNFQSVTSVGSNPR